MEHLYKLTDRDGYTRRGIEGYETHWTPGETVTVTNSELPPVLCSSGVLHAYQHPLLGIMMNPVHAGIENPRLFICKGDVVANDGAMVGCRQLTCSEELDIDWSVSMSSRVRWAIKLARATQAGISPAWRSWADRWISGADRTYASAETARKLIDTHGYPWGGHATTAACFAAHWAAIGSSQSERQAGYWAAKTAMVSKGRTGDPESWTLLTNQCAIRAIKEEEKEPCPS